MTKALDMGSSCAISLSAGYKNASRQRKTFGSKGVKKANEGPSNGDDDIIVDPV